MRISLFLIAALPCLGAGAGAAQAADITHAKTTRAAPAVIVTRVAAGCPPIPVVVARGRRGMGEPGSFHSYWDWRIPRACNLVFGR